VHEGQDGAGSQGREESNTAGLAVSVTEVGRNGAANADGAQGADDADVERGPGPANGRRP